MLRATEYDPISKTRVEYHFAGEDLIIASETDITGAVEVNKALYASQDERKTWGGNGDQLGSLVARIPDQVYFQIPKEIRNDQKAMKRWLNDYDNRVFRTRPGRV